MCFHCACQPYGHPSSDLLDMQCHQRLCIQTQHMDKYMVCIGIVTHVSACNSKGICPSTQSSGTCMEAPVMQLPSLGQGILCYPVHACTLGSDCEPLACMQNTEYVRWSTVKPHVRALLTNMHTTSTCFSGFTNM
jgi:hypothetical protein